MKQAAFIEQNQLVWQRFEELLNKLEQRTWLPGRLARRIATTGNNKSEESLKDVEVSAELTEFAQLYRSVCQYQSMAKTRQYSSHLVGKLDDLVLRGHQILYQQKSASLSALIKFILIEFPGLVRKEYKLFWLATAFLYLPAVLVFFAVMINPDFIYTVMSSGDVQNMESMYNPANSHFGEERGSSSDFGMFGFYIMNNIGVGFRAFALGLTLGLGTIAVLVLNGLMLGAVLAHLLLVGYFLTISSFVIGHGSFELTAFVISGMAGLKLGYSILNPGNMRRSRALRMASASAVKLVFGAFIMLVIAAFIEAFWSSTAALAYSIKYTVGGGLWLLLGWYFLKSGVTADES